MLKIKDNIDLKELEKFGFEEISGFWYAKKIFKERKDIVSVGINRETREIQLAWSIQGYVCEFTYDLDFLFDLIQAGLVEKVEEENK